MSVAALSKKPFIWRWDAVFAVYLQFAVIAAWFLVLPIDISEPYIGRLFTALGALAIWRYGWWLTHFVRAWIYEHHTFPEMRARANDLVASGWRPERVAFMMTTYKEHPVTTRKVLISIIREAEMIGVPCILFVGTGDPYDEGIIAEEIERRGSDMPDGFQVVYVRQNKPGKRIAIGLTLRAMSREGIGGETPIVFLDGDSIMEPGCVMACAPFFHMYPKMHALTTHERPLVYGHPMMQRWFDIRFAQRQMAMQSHALSWRVLTLTGRMSIIRASAVMDEEFISLVEMDSLYNWHWGSFRFLSGDDKSTWYTLLKRGAEMMYVPDATVHTVERIEKEWINRASQNLLRWSGNMLRNGSRAIAIGPKKMGFFIWWCIIDQRIAMWTCLAGPIAVICGAFLWTPMLLLALPPWVLFTRGLLSMFLYYHHRSIDPLFPFILYGNQIGSSVLKIYILFRLPMQRWANRGDQRAFSEIDWSLKLKTWMASYITLLWCAAFVFAVVHYTGVVSTPLEVYAVKLLDFLL